MTKENQNTFKYGEYGDWHERHEKLRESGEYLPLIQAFLDHREEVWNERPLFEYEKEFIVMMHDTITFFEDRQLVETLQRRKNDTQD